MKRTLSFFFLLVLVMVSACSTAPSITEVDETQTATPTLPDPQVYVTSAPDIERTLSGFMSAWQSEDYSTMYALLNDESHDRVGEDDFITFYRDTAAALTLSFEEGIDFEILSTTTNPEQAAARVQVQYNTYLFGSLTREINPTLTREGRDWRFVWDEGLVMPELAGGNRLETILETTPRGNIYANDGSPIAAQEDVVAIGFIPGYLDEGLMGLFYRTMAQLTIYQQDEIVEMVENAFPSDYVVLGEVPQAEVERNMTALSALSGVYLSYYASRFYYDGGIAPQTVGHLSYISAEEQYEYLRRGYAISERFGSTGLERSFEDELSGDRGAALYVKDANGQILAKLGEKLATQGQSITTTIDLRLQYLLQQSLGDYRGAIVVMEIDTGRVLAMVSNPQFDPNLFDIENQNFVYAQSPYSETGDPVFNRATNGQYPLGSVFKIITMAAALETGVFTAESEIYCGHSIIACGSELFDWTYEKERPPSGDLTLPEGLMRSCNPWFYTIGEQLYNEGYSSAIADMARGFGLGEVTGVEVPEEPGNITAETNTCEANVQLAIGQGDMTVTPLQVVRFIAAVGNGGTLYRPTLIEEIAPDDGSATYTFEPEAIGTLPVSEENLSLIQGAMYDVIKEARGTAHLQLATMPYVAFGKTGTATNPFGDPHAWFAGYTQVGNEDRPDIAVAVLLENGGEGSEMAAPVFRRAVSLYFSYFTSPGYTLPWEAYPYVVASPTPLPTNTPLPTLTPIPTETPMEGEEGTGEP
ncbi:MAG: penicillin-binding transpeptidase domain-containing protein [Anaerolineales bacterium]